MIGRLATLSIGANAMLWPVQPTREEFEADLRQVQENLAAEKGSEEFTVNPTICDSSVKQTAGRITTQPGNATAPQYFFWLFESKSDPAKDPLIMWLSGGPGCSSQLALLAENGPCSIDKQGKAEINPYSWHNKANVMWVDQPAGVGFSTGFGTHGEGGVARNMAGFLQGFYSKFPSYQNNKFFIFGESYAGHYVPAISHHLWQDNKDGKGIHIPLAGIGIGNGLTNTEEQYKWYPKFGKDGCAAEGGHAPGVLSNGAVNVMKAAMPACTFATHLCNTGSKDPDTGLLVNYTACLQAFDMCNLLGQMPIEATDRNPYDVRIKCEKTPLCYDFDDATAWLNSKDVQSQLGVNKKWNSCNRAVDLAFSAAGDWMRNFHTDIPDLLNDGLEVLIYAGEMDYLCNFCGNKAWTKALEWNGKDAFNKAADEEWSSSGSSSAAKKRSAQGFHFMQIYDAGHLAPMDKPEVTLDMVNRFISGTLGNDVVV